MAKKPAPIVIRLTTTGLADVQKAFSAIGKAARVSVSTVNAIGSSLKKVAKVSAVAGASVAGIGAGLTAAAKAGIASIAEQDRFAKSVGMTVEQYQALRYSAERAGVDVDGLNGFLINLADKATDAANGSESAAQQLADLGVSAVDAKGRLKSMPQLVNDLSNAVSRMPDGARKTGLLSILAGDDGARAIGWLNAGAKGLKRQAQEAENLGLIMSESQAEMAREVDVSVRLAQTSVKSLRDSLALLFAPDIQAGADNLTVKIAENREEILDWAFVARETVAGIATELYNVLFLKQPPSTGWMTTALGFIEQMSAFKDKALEVAEALGPKLSQALDETVATLKTVRQTIDDMTRVTGDFVSLFTKSGSIETPWIADLQDDWESFSTTVDGAWRNLIKPTIDAFHGALGVLADGVNAVFGKEGTDKWTGGQLAFAAGLASITGLLPGFTKLAGAIAGIAKSFGAVATAVGLIETSVLAITAGVAVGVESAGKTARTQEEVEKRALVIAETSGDAAAAAYQKAFLDRMTSGLGFKVANAIGSALGNGVDVEGIRGQLDELIGDDTAGAALGEKLARVDMGLVVDDVSLDPDVQSYLASLKSHALIEDTTLSDEVSAGLQQLKAGIRIENIKISPEAMSKLQEIESRRILPRNMQGYAVGGLIRGPGTGTSDSILARVSNNEFIMKAAAVRKWGVGFLDMLNRGVLPAFAAGGLVSMPAPAGVSSVSSMLSSGGGRPVLLQLPDGSTTSLRGSEDAVTQLEKSLRRSRTASAGRKPTWYK